MSGTFSLFRILFFLFLFFGLFDIFNFSLFLLFVCFFIFNFSLFISFLYNLIKLLIYRFSIIFYKYPLTFAYLLHFVFLGAIFLGVFTSQARMLKSEFLIIVYILFILYLFYIYFTFILHLFYIYFIFILCLFYISFMFVLYFLSKNVMNTKRI